MKFQSSSAAYTFGKLPRFPVQLALTVLKVTTLKVTSFCSVWVAVEDLRLTEVYAMACHECMFCQCKSGHIAIPQSMPMLLQPVFQGSTRLPNVHRWAWCAGNRVDHSFSFIHWHSVLGVSQQLGKGHQRATHHLDVYSVRTRLIIFNRLLMYGNISVALVSALFCLAFICPAKIACT